MKRICFLLLAGLLTAQLSSFASAADVERLTETINAIGLDGQGYPAAVDAEQLLGKLDVEAIPQILAAMDTQKPVAANWLRGAVESIADRSRKEGHPIPNKLLIDFIEKSDNSPKGRTVAFHLLEKQDPTTAAKLVPSFADDASLELRLLAVDKMMEVAQQQLDSDHKAAAIAIYRKALDATRSADQASEIAKALKKLDVEVDTTEHFGFLKSWHVIAPFDFDKGKGFDTVYPPEEEIDLTARYGGKLIDELPNAAKWKPLELKAGEKKVDFNQAFAPVKEVVGYAVTTFDSESKQDVELRWGSPNATKVWVNGKLVASNKVYHSGDKFDQYKAWVTLEKGENKILVKLVQNEQTQPWTNVWFFDLRVCDALGTAIHDAKP